MTINDKLEAALYELSHLRPDNSVVPVILEYEAVKEKYPWVSDAAIIRYLRHEYTHRSRRTSP